ncbi:MAG: type II secretion system protein GspC [Gammaproteobacteria bacterium]|nr:type II secretion system protein GspC [Gammaproteobacteria bacterium]
MNMQDLISRWSSQSPEQLVARASQHLPFWVSLLFVVLIAYYLARIAWMLYPATDDVTWTPPAMTGAGQRANVGADRSTDYGSIVDAHLFGTATESVAPVVAETENAPDTRLNLKLRAAVAATSEEVAHAIIADGSGNEQVYFIKSSIPGGATLHRVHADRVILNRGGVLETLRLPRDFEGSAAATSARRSPPAASRRASNVQELLTNNAASLTEIIRPQPFMPNGQLKGYRVFPGRNRQQFIALGLRPGDLVTAVNGVALNNPAQGMEIFRSLGDSSQVSVTVERAGQEQQLNLDIGQLTNASGNTR